MSFCGNGQTLQIYLIQLITHQRRLPRSPAETTSLSGADNEALQFSTVQNQPRQIHQGLGLSHLAVPRSRCGVMLSVALLCVWGPQENLTLHLWERTYSKVVQVLSQTHGWGVDSITGNPLLFSDCSTPALYPSESHFLFSVS